MAELQKILVGVDLLQSRRGELSPPVAEAVRQGIGLAERTSGQVTFFTAIDLPEEEEFYDSPLGRREGIIAEIELSAQEALKKLVADAAKRGVRAESEWTIGQDWIELISEATDGKYDLAVVGTRSQGAHGRSLFGSTAMKLLHNCPIPVWVAKPEPRPTPRKVLAASDFSEMSNEVLRFALRIGTATKAEVHLIHVLEHPFARLWEAGLLEARAEELRQAEVRAAAERRLKEQLSRVSSNARSEVEVSIVEAVSVPDHAIAKYIEEHEIDLLIIGTSARRGFAGVFLGNTAERLLTSTKCSLLAVKPAGFVCPVRLESFPHTQPAAHFK